MSIHHHHHHAACPVVTTVELSPQVISRSSCSWHGAVLLPKWLHSSITITLHAEFIECCYTKSALEVDKMLTVWSYTSLKSFKYTFKNSSAINSEVVMAGWQNKHKSDSIIHGHVKQGWLGGRVDIFGLLVSSKMWVLGCGPCQDWFIPCDQTAWCVCCK